MRLGPNRKPESGNRKHPKAASSPVSGFRFPVFSALLAFAILSGSAALAHPIHRSIAEANYNRTTKSLEIALRVFADDFEDALGNFAKKKISLEKTPAGELDQLIPAYVAKRFTISSSDGTPVAHRWLGRELKDAENELWFYFEVSLPGGAEGTRILHAVLAEHFRDQLNSVLVRDGERKVTLVFLPTHSEKVVRFRQ